MSRIHEESQEFKKNLKIILRKGCAKRHGPCVVNTSTLEHSSCTKGGFIKNIQERRGERRDPNLDPAKRGLLPTVLTAKVPTTLPTIWVRPTLMLA